MLKKPVYFNMFPNESENPKAPTHKWNNFEIKEDIVIPKGKYDIAFFGNAISKEGQNKPYLKIDNPYKKQEQKGNISSSSGQSDPMDDDMPF